MQREKKSSAPFPICELKSTTQFIGGEHWRVIEVLFVYQ